MDAAGRNDAGVRLPVDVPAMFADVAPIGPFFSVATGTAPSGGGWVPLRALHGDAAPLRTRVAAVRAALGTDDRVAASTAFQGVAAQVVAPLFGAAALVGALPAAGAADPGPGRLADVLHWRPGGGGPWLWWAGTAGRVVACADPGAAALGGAVTGLLGPIVAAVRAQVSISERVLWGDVASAVASARRLVVAARPEAAQRATAVAERLLGGPLLARTAALRAPSRRTSPGRSGGGRAASTTACRAARCAATASCWTGGLVVDTSRSGAGRPRA